MGGQVEGLDGRMGGWEDGWMDGQEDGWMDGREDRWMDGREDGWMDDSSEEGCREVGVTTWRRGGRRKT